MPRFRRYDDQMEFSTIVVLASGVLLLYAAWLTSIVFCAANHMKPLMIASATIFPVGIVHGIGLWFGGW